MQETDSELQSLKTKVLMYEQDALYSLFFSVNRKANEISQSLNEAELKLNSEDKVFDRFLKLIEKLDPLIKALAVLRQDYLKISDDDAVEAEKKGIPLIERRAGQKRGK